MQIQDIKPGTRVAIKQYSRFPRHWRYTQRQYSGKVATVEKIEHDTVNQQHGYRLDIDNQFHRWYLKDFAAVNVTGDVHPKKPQPQEIVTEELPTRCPKCKSPDLDITEELEIVNMQEVRRVIFCDNCGANILLRYKFFGTTCIPIR